MTATIPRRPRWPLSLPQRARLAELLVGLRRPEDLRLLARSGAATRGFAMHAEWIAFRLEAGSSLSRAVASLETSFDEHDAALLRAGESTARLPRAVVLWARLLRVRAEAWRLLRGAALLPLATLAATLVAAALIAASLNGDLAWIRSFVAELEASGVEHPATDLAFLLASVLGSAGLVLMVASASCLAALAFPERLPTARKAIDHVALAVPGLGALVRRQARWLVLETLATSVGGGGTPPSALRAAAGASRNASVRGELLRAAGALESGGTWSELPRGAVLDASTLRALDLAFRRPDAGEALARSARREELGTGRAVRRLGSLAPGVATIVVGILAGILVVGSYSLLFSMAWGVP